MSPSLAHSVCLPRPRDSSLSFHLLSLTHTSPQGCSCSKYHWALLNLGFEILVPNSRLLHLVIWKVTAASSIINLTKRTISVIVLVLKEGQVHGLHLEMLNFPKFVVLL